MSPETLAGLIGAGGALGGALVGGMATFLGVVYQQRHQADLARAHRRDALTEHAALTLLNELEQLENFAWAAPGDDDAPVETTQEILDSLDRIRLAALRVPHEELRDLIEVASLFGFGMSQRLETALGYPERMLVTHTCGETKRCLAALMRQEELPKMVYLQAAREQHKAIIRGSQH